ncbi:MAG TPA: DUF721 domain-containing protein [Solirubrobacteraceae bacterium]|jgi:predicted nucleic acid-binding Zn ribbon protein
MRRAPRRLSIPLAHLRGELAPASTLAEVQLVWETAVGEAMAANARPTAERDGVLTVLCSASVWASELTMMAPEVLARVNDALDSQTCLQELRCRTR